MLGRVNIVGHASSTKWGLGENLFLQLMERLTPTFSFDIFME